MQNLCPEGDWAMAAILGLEDEEVENVCKKVTKGFVQPANYNCPGQVAISGDKAGIEEATIYAKELGAKRVIELKTSGPFHTEKLSEASQELAKFIENKEIKTPENLVIKNIDATPYTNQDNIKEILSKHVMSPTRISDTIKYMLENGITNFIEIGPGKTLTNFVRKIDKTVNCININNAENLKNFIKSI